MIESTQLSIDIDLSSNVFYILETIKICSSSDNLLSENEKSKLLNLAIRVCLDCAKSIEETNRINAEIFKYLIGSYLELDMCLIGQKLSFETIMSLAIENRLVNTAAIFDPILKQQTEKVNDFFEKTHSYLKSMLEKRIDRDKTLLFLTDFYLENSVFQDLLNQSISSFWDSNEDASFIFNKLLSKIYDEFSYHLSEDANFESRAAVFQLNEKLNDYLKLATFLNQPRIRLNDPKKTTKIWAFSYVLSQMHNNSSRVLQDFSQLIREKCEAHLKSQLDHHFAIRNKLPGFQWFIKRLVLDDSALDDQTLITLKNVPNSLADRQLVYFFLLKLNSQDKSSELSSKSTSTFWDGFNALELDEKIKLIQLIQSNTKIKREKKDGSISCLFEENEFNNELTLLINKLSSNDFENMKISNLMVKLVCKSPETVFYRLILAFLIDKTQIETLIKILDKYSIVLKCNRLLLNLIKKILFYIIKQRNEKMFQNFLTLLRLIVKPSVEIFGKEQTHEFLIGSSDFYEVVLLNSYFKSKSIQMNCLYYVLEVFELFTKLAVPDLTNLVYLMEIVDSLDIKLAVKNSNKRVVQECLKLKEKCFDLIENVAQKLSFYIKPDDESFLWFNEYIKSFYWPYNILLISLTRKLDLFEGTYLLSTNNVELFSSEFDFELLLEASAMKPIKFDGLSNQLEKLDYDYILKTFIKTISKKRTNMEIANLFKFFTNVQLNLEVDSQLKNIDVEGLKWAKMLHLFTDMLWIVNSKMDTTLILINLIKFAKEKTFKIESKNPIVFVLITTFYFGKLANFIEIESNVEEICKFVIETANRVKTTEILIEDKVVISFLSGSCLQLFSNLDYSSFKNYRYLIDKFISKIREKINI